MNFYPLHSITGDYDNLTEKEYSALRESIRKHGILVPIVIWNDQIVDGRHRYNVACSLGMEPVYLDITAECPNEESMKAHVRALNENRRARTMPLTKEEKDARDARIHATLKANPDRSDRQIARAAGTSHPKVARERAKLEQSNELERSSSRIGADGKSRPARPAPKPELTPAENLERHASHERLKFVNAPVAPAQRVNKAKDDDVLGIAYTVRRLTADDRIVILCNWIIDRLTH